MSDSSFTLTAGPVAATDKVRDALLERRSSYSYDEIFLQRFRDTQTKVAEVFGTAADVVLMQGEAVLGLEAAACALVNRDVTCLNLVSGVYSKWYGDRLRSLGATVIEVTVPFDSAIDPADVEAALREHPNISVVAVVHCETPSGTLNPISEIGPIAQEHGALTICDVVSSLAGNEVCPDDSGLDICVAGPQKCLGATPGLSLVTVSDRAWARMRANPGAPRRSYISLLDWKEHWSKNGTCVYPLGGDSHTDLRPPLQRRFPGRRPRRHRSRRRRPRPSACRGGRRSSDGAQLWPRSDKIAASCVTAVRLPDGVDEAQLRQLIRDRSGVIISGAQGELVGKVVRIGHMGLASRSLYPLVGVTALAQGLKELGVPVDVGSAAEATINELTQPLATTAYTTTEGAR